MGPICNGAEFGAVEVQRPILPAMGPIVKETPIYGIVIIHMELSKATTNIAFP
jgi:hypothetical protein